MSGLRLSVSTGSDGSYTLPGLPPGSCQVTAGHATTQNFQLTGVMHQTVSGTVTGGTPTAWPVYARVSWTDGNGHSGTTYTTPSTGEYSLSLDSGSYTLTVTRQHQRRAL